MVELVQLMPAALAGAALGALFFGGLLWTVRNGLRSPHPARWFALSLAARTAVVLAGFYFAAAGDWRKMLACLCGFIFARAAVTRLGSASLDKETHRASQP